MEQEEVAPVPVFIGTQDIEGVQVVDDGFSGNRLSVSPIRTREEASDPAKRNAQYIRELAAKKKREEKMQRKKVAKEAARKEKLAQAVLGDRGSGGESKLYAPTAAAEARRKEREEAEAKKKEEESKRKEGALTPRKAEAVAKSLRKQHKQFLAKLAKKQKAAEQEMKEAAKAKEQLKAKVRKAALKGSDVKSRLLQPTASFSSHVGDAAAAAEAAPSKDEGVAPLPAVRGRKASDGTESLGTIAAVRRSAREEVSSQESERRHSGISAPPRPQAPNEGKDAEAKESVLHRLRQRQVEHLQRLKQQRLEKEAERARQAEEEKEKAEKVRKGALARMASLRQQPLQGDDGDASVAAQRGRVEGSAREGCAKDGKGARRRPQRLSTSPVRCEGNEEGKAARTQRRRQAREERMQDRGNMLLPSEGLVMDEARWRKRQGISDDQKVFILTGWYPDLQASLFERGWKQNPDRHSPFFDLKWTLKSKDIHHSALKSGQLANHFHRASQITTKSGLLHCLQSLRWFESVDIDTFYPRGYDLSAPTGYADFLDDYRVQHAIGILQRCVLPDHQAGIGPASAGDAGKPAFWCPSLKELKEIAEGVQLLPSWLNGRHINKGVLSTVLDICRRRCSDYAMDDVDAAGPEPLLPISEAEWEIIRWCNPWLPGGPMQQAPSTWRREKRERRQKRRAWRLNNAAQRQQKRKTAKARKMKLAVPQSVTQEGGTAQGTRQPSRQSSPASEADAQVKPGEEEVPGVEDAGHNEGNKTEDDEHGANGDGNGADDDGDEGDDDDDEEEDDEDDAGDNEDEGDGDDGDDGDDEEGEEEEDVAGYTAGEAGKLVDDSSDDDSLALDSSRMVSLDALPAGDVVLSTGRSSSGAKQQQQQQQQPRATALQQPSYCDVTDSIQANPQPTISGHAPSWASLLTVDTLSDRAWRDVFAVLAALAALPSTQWSLNGWPLRNVWIVKPAGKSRGRGIECSDQLNKLLENRGQGGPTETHWVVQRYIERPLVVFNRKFDIRQWVLVTSWNPLQVWFFKECYLRFCVYDFTLDDLGNKFVHLSNNSIQKHSKRFKRSEIKGNMWHCKEFAQYLEAQEGYDIWTKRIHPQMKRIVTYSVQSAQDMIESRQGSFELYGYDFMIDAEYNPWLIEINSSPDFSYSTSITKQLVKAAGEDTMKVVLDYRNAPAKKKGGVDTGLWELIHSSKVTVARTLGALSHEFVAKGDPVFPRRQCGSAAVPTH